MDKNTEIFMNINNVELGPYHLNQLVENGLEPDALVWWQGSANWMKASEVPELQPLLQQVAAQQPAQAPLPAQPMPEPAAQPDGGEQATMACPYCGETILAVARKCRFCGEWLQPIDGNGYQETMVAQPVTGLPTTVGPAEMPPISQPGMPPISQPGMTPISQPGMTPISQPGMPPISQPGMPPISQPGGYPSVPQSMGYDGTPVSYPTGYDAMPPTGYPGMPPAMDQYGNPSDPNMSYGDPQMPPAKKSNKGIIIAIIVAAVVAIIVAVIVFVVNNSPRPHYEDTYDTDYGYGDTYESAEAASEAVEEADYYDPRYYDDSSTGEDAEAAAPVAYQ